MMDEAGTLWSSGELDNTVLAIDPFTDAVQRVDVGATAHWVAVSHATAKVYIRIGKQDCVVVVDMARRSAIDRIKLPQVVEGLAISPDGTTLYVCAQTAAGFYLIDARSHALRRTVPIDGTDGAKKQMRRVRVSPDDKYVVVSSNQDHHAAIYEADGLTQVASFPAKKSTMGFGFAADGIHAYLCCHDDAVVFEFELATGRLTRTFSTPAGCEFIVAYGCGACNVDRHPEEAERSEALEG
jgi:DNA-binding beta-propeller fold protein YncE